MSGLPDPLGFLFGGGGSAARALTPPAPTAGNTHPTTTSSSGPKATATKATATTGAARGGKSRLLPFFIGVGLAFALADTPARPIVVALLVGAIIFQLARATPAQP